MPSIEENNSGGTARRERVNVGELINPPTPSGETAAAAATHNTTTDSPSKNTRSMMLAAKMREWDDNRPDSPSDEDSDEEHDRLFAKKPKAKKKGKKKSTAPSTSKNNSSGRKSGYTEEQKQKQLDWAKQKKIDDVVLDEAGETVFTIAGAPFANMQNTVKVAFIKANKIPIGQGERNPKIFCCWK
mmetsp:Transcript_26502/g.53195  ORF Transcript_26502/g.53195 Transcript_26502/m.53195 type:complete len:186 (+) Transcript_26502:119-676(+)